MPTKAEEKEVARRDAIIKEKSIESLIASLAARFNGGVGNLSFVSKLLDAIPRLERSEKRQCFQKGARVLQCDTLVDVDWIKAELDEIITRLQREADACLSGN